MLIEEMEKYIISKKMKGANMSTAEDWNHCLMRTKNLVKTYKDNNVVDDVSMTINKGDIYGFIGENGAGKTTFIRLLARLIEKSAGDLQLNKVKAMTMGAVIEGPACYPYLSARDNLKYFAIQRNIKDKNRIDEVLEFVGLAGVDKRKTFKDFSLGMKQRLGIGLAIMEHPDFLILDEPINGLDPRGIVEIREIIHQLNKEYGTTILISSHILNELALVASRYGIIHQGKLVKELTRDELMSECGQYIFLESSNNDLSYHLLKKKDYHIEQNSSGIIIRDTKERMKDISSLLFKNNVYATNYYYKEANLEEYYLNLIHRRKRHD
nr:ATP-binding cassette domain-containing protein [Niallia taxi]